MPRTLPQKLFFMVLTVLVTVHVFVVYNVAISMGGMSNRVFAVAERDVPLEFIVAFLLEGLVVYHLANRMAFRLVDPKRDRPIVVILAITCMTVVLMCPAMSFAATVIYDGVNAEFVANWLRKIVYNFPLAFFSQIFFIGPLVRTVFGLLFRQREPAGEAESVLALELEPEGEYS